MNSISAITLHNFRNYQHLRIDCAQQPMLIIGPNGAGKTNILEAVSLLTPGRGLRGAHIQEMSYQNGESWAINADIQCDDISHNVGVGLCDHRKIIKIDHKVQSTQMALSEVGNLVWLTPQMDTIFIGSRSARLNFFDRIVFTFDGQHATNVAEYERAKRERATLLREQILDHYWLSTLEEKMVRTGVAVARSRVQVISTLQDRIEHGPFNNIKVYIEGEVEMAIADAQDIAEIFSVTLKQNRQHDTLVKRTKYGVHTSDFRAKNVQKSVEAKLCSTGEQKLMLIAIVLAAAQYGTILLLDDIISHLDPTNRDILLATILQRGCQAWITDTNLHNFTEYSREMQIFHVGITSDN